MAIGAAPSLLGIGPGSNSLEKLRIVYEEKGEGIWDGEIEALFNPSEFQISQSVSWETIGGGGEGTKTMIEQRFQSVAPRTTSIDLFFDSYEEHDRSLLAGYMPSLNPLPTATNVTVYTKALAKLSEVNAEMHRPPICKLEWGGFGTIFVGVLDQLTQKFTMFMANGMPVRATVSCSFIEFQLTDTELHSPDVHKTYTVGRNDTLHGIASQMYNDASKWRVIARANGITNPRLVSSGTILMIPKL